jgi:hypothetical protein
VLEQHIAHPFRQDGLEIFKDSVGIGCYRIDLHPRISGAGYLDLGCWPFQIPLGAMIPVRVENLLPGGKNLGVTHITNGAFRVHPVESERGRVCGDSGGFLLGAEDREALNASAVITVRDRLGYRLLQDTGVTQEIHLTADPAFLLQSRHLPKTP